MEIEKRSIVNKSEQWQNIIYAYGLLFFQKKEFY